MKTPVAHKEWQALLQLAWPMMLTQFFIMATGFLDTMMAGRYGAEDLAGVSLGGNILWPPFMLLTGITMAVTPIVSQLRGAGKLGLAGPRIRQALWLCVVNSLLLIAFYVNAESILNMVGVQGPVLRIATDYLHAAAWGMPAIVLYVALRQIMEGMGRTRPPMLISAAVVPLNGVLNYWFIYGNPVLGIPEMGGVGCGWATAIVFWFELILMLFLVRKPYFRATAVWERFDWPDFGELARLLKLGVPIGLSIFLEMAVFSVMSIAIANIGTIELAAHSIAGNLNWLTYVLPAGLGAAAGIRVGYFVGAQDLPAARHAAGIAYRFALVYGIVVSVLLVLGRHLLISIYTNDNAVAGIALSLLWFVALYQIVDDLNAVAVGSLRGYKDTTGPMLYGLIGFWVVAIPLGTLLAFGWEGKVEPIGVYGYWVALSIGLFFVALAVSVRLYRVSCDPVRISRFAQE